jgi:signal recognition particle subunit SEC65
VRVAFFVLVALNLAYLVWAGWIAAPAEVPIVTSTTTATPLQTLTLVREASAREDAVPLAQPLSQPVGQSAGAREAQALSAVTDATPASAGRCVSVGPFNDLAHAARGAALLRERGFDPRQRAEQGETWEGYWVSVGGLKSSAEETKVVSALTRAGITDARAMPEQDGGRRVSVGLFSEKDRAEKRAQAVKKLGFKAEVSERRQPGTVYWVDLDLGANDRTVPTEGLLSLENAGSRLEIRVCPETATAPSRPQTSPRDARPSTTTANAGAAPA